MSEPTVETPLYRKVLYKGPPEHATPLYLIDCDEGWCVSIVCEGIYEWTADWLLELIQGKPYAPEHRPDRRPVHPSSRDTPQYCHAGSDGECNWKDCPQEANNRANYQTFCPLATSRDTEGDQ